VRARLEAIKRRLRPCRIELHPGETVVLGMRVGRGHYKDVFRIRGREHVLKILNDHSQHAQGRRGILLEVEGEAKLRELGIAFAASSAHDPEGRWIITEHVPERTIADLIRLRSRAMLSAELAEATAHVIERLRSASCMMDMGTPNWSLRHTVSGPRLVALEAAIKSDNGDPLWFECTYLPLWIMHLARIELRAGSHRDLFRITADDLENLQDAWALDEAFAEWRQRFGAKLPDPHPPWTVVDTTPSVV